LTIRSGKYQILSKRDELERGIEKIENDINPSEEDNIKSIWGCTNDHRKVDTNHLSIGKGYI